MTHPITPPPELISQWLKEFYGPETMPGMTPGEAVLHVAAVAARWGADVQLEAVCEWLRRAGIEQGFIDELRAACRPKPPSLKEQALIVLDDASSRLDAAHENIIRRALESLPDPQD